MTFTRTDKKEKPLQRKVLPVEVKEADDDRTLEMTISTENPDRDNDTIRASGWKLQNYKKNPVVLWAHSYRHPPIARATSVKTEDGKLISQAEFTPEEIYPFGHMVYRMYKGKFLHATSVGFMPLKWEEDEERGGVNFTQQELLEYSAVPVPANPEALLGAKNAGIDLAPLKEWAEEVLDTKELWTPEDAEDARKAWDQLKIPQFQVPGFGVSTNWNGTHDHQLDIEVTADVEGDDKGIAPSDVSRTTASPDTSWSAPTLSSFTSQNWESLSVADKKKITGHYAWATANPPSTFGGLKLPHHRPRDGAVVWRGVVSAMAALMGARGGTSIPDADMRKVYNHLASHYEQFDKKPPEFDSDEIEFVRELLEAGPTDEEYTVALDVDSSPLKEILDDLRAQVDALKEDKEQSDGLSTDDDGDDNDGEEDDNLVLELADEVEEDLVLEEDIDVSTIREAVRAYMDEVKMQTTGQIR